MLTIQSIFRLICLNLFLIFTSNAQIPYKLTVDFDEKNIPPPPDYSSQQSWCALPQMKDMADSLPIGSGLKDGQQGAQADVFFIHPTIYTGEPTNTYYWNADVYDDKMNKQVDESTILNQATAFNGSCRVFAPRYRQAHYSAFTTTNPENKLKSLTLAYEDVKKAFEYYLENYNNGRPIVIAGHSQGTIHAKLLLKDYFENKPLKNQLVEAYLIGIATAASEFDEIKPSQTASQTGGFVTWNTFLKGYYPDYYTNGLNKAVCTNPLTWTCDETYAPKELNSGGVGLKFKFAKNPADAQVHKGMLWINKPYVPGRMFLKTKIWHRADINLYWMNIRENVALRLENFLSESK